MNNVSTDIDETTYPFSPVEFERLSVYRAAVLAGFYNEDDGLAHADVSDTDP